jgi:hypothetical protein
MSVSEVVAALGPPTTTRPMYSKGKQREPAGTALDYKVRAQGEAPNMNDVMLLLVFDRSGRLIWAYPQNIPGFAEMGSRQPTNG